MSHIKGKDTSIEIKVRHWLYHCGIRYRKNNKGIPGTPDISIKKYKIAIFVNGCFWHGHKDCKYFKLPMSNVEFWENKITRNIDRDYAIYEKLRAEGWLVLVLWECELKRDFNQVMTKCHSMIIDRIKENSL
jgi:DNA mismatch endonuclease (patch repair protein)